jgi:hypothetical protein
MHNKHGLADFGVYRDAAPFTIYKPSISRKQQVIVKGAEKKKKKELTNFFFLWKLGTFDLMQSFGAKLVWQLMLHQ